MLFSEKEVFPDISKLTTNKAVGTDEISNRLPIKGFIPDSVKNYIITPVPKFSPPTDIKSDIRPIALTSCLAKDLEGLNHRRLLKQVGCDMDTRQYARKGHSTTHALTYLLHIIYEAVVDSGNCSARKFLNQTMYGLELS